MNKEVYQEIAHDNTVAKQIGASAIILSIYSLDNPGQNPTRVEINTDARVIAIGTEELLDTRDENTVFIDTSHEYGPAELLTLRREFGFLFIAEQELAPNTNAHPIVRRHANTDAEYDMVARSYGSTLHEVRQGDRLIMLKNIVDIESL